MFNLFQKKHKIVASFLMVIAFLLFYLLFNFNGKNGALASLQTTQEQENNNGINLSPFWRVWGVIKEKHPDGGKVSDQDKIYGSISGLVSSLNDPYSVFFKPDEKKFFEDEISGSFEGVGMEVGIKNKIFTVIAPLKGTPAEKAGVRVGDKILKIDDKSTFDLNLEQGIKMIRGKKGTVVTLFILHEDENDPVEIKITRGVIQIPTLDTEFKKKGNIFIIKLYSFSATSANLFEKSIREFVKLKTNKLIIDLRGNPGGYLDSAVQMASFFLEKGKTIVIQDFAKKEENVSDNNKEGNKRKEFKSFGYDIIPKKRLKNLKVIILIDQGSASASEILAGALKEHGIAKLVGMKSYGKGSVQEVFDISDDTILKLTVAKWLTPNGNLIENQGIKPDFEIEIKKTDVEKKKDPQMDKAIELLNRP